MHAALGLLYVLLTQCDSRRMSYMAGAYCRFMAAYARGQYEDAAIWCRRIAECFCIVVLRDGYAVQEVGLLGEMLYQLLEHLVNARVWDALWYSRLNRHQYGVLLEYSEYTGRSRMASVVRQSGRTCALVFRWQPCEGQARGGDRSAPYCAAFRVL